MSSKESTLTYAYARVSSHDQKEDLQRQKELIFTLCEIHQVEVVIINQGEDLSFEEDLAKDVLEAAKVLLKDE